jgi:hypothetical protein
LQSSRWIPAYAGMTPEQNQIRRSGFAFLGTQMRRRVVVARDLLF